MLLKTRLSVDRTALDYVRGRQGILAASEEAACEKTISLARGR
jgi:hypothetical protein